MAHFTLELSSNATTGAIALWESDTKTGPVPLTAGAVAWTVGIDAIPDRLFVEAAQSGMIQFSLALSAPNASIAAIDYVLFTVLAADGGDGKLNLVIHDGQNGKAVPDADEDKTGAVTVANLNDTDADKTVDAQDDDVREMRTGDNKHGRNELDLMKLLVHKPKGYAGGDVKLTVTPKERVMLWTNSWKETPLAEYDPDTGVATFSSWGANEKSKTVWVEVKSKSDTVADISLELTYDTFVPDKVVATGVWMTKTDAIFATKSWDELEDSVWRTDLDERLQTDVKLNGGTGINPFVSFFTDATKARIQNRMIMQFTVSPVDVETELSRVKFDISRQKQGKSWDNVGTDPHLTEEKDWKLQWEEADDDSNNSDESFKVNGSGRMYSTDGCSGPQALDQKLVYISTREKRPVRPFPGLARPRMRIPRWPLSARP